MINLLIFATLWQGMFAFMPIQLNAVDTLNAVNTESPACHQTTFPKHTPLNATPDDISNDKQDCCDKSDVGCCNYCTYCTYCGIGLISSFFSFHFFPIILNHIDFPPFLDEHSAQLFKPPRTFRS
ncbi:hypothetical protein [Candidatus Parabeggiatoa sp. HSG14]|uniref:hypothetical protein n=1 Tax=Candidatus Parabeggiatoa sp. HSG14 TaxID=3055593 RepID=UPI0025A82A95|nr:hypothetical protein [Thiotrichales bacterium HSG14]